MRKMAVVGDDLVVKAYIMTTRRTLEKLLFRISVFHTVCAHLQIYTYTKCGRNILVSY